MGDCVNRRPASDLVGDHRRPLGWVGSCLIVAAGLALSLWAQTSQAQDATFTVRQLTPETALKAADAALKFCRNAGYQAAVAVVDRAGTLQVLLRDRLAGPHTVDIATNKAWTAASFRQDTATLGQVSERIEMSGLRQFPRVVVVGGGLPIDGGGTQLGAIGVSGAPGGAADAKCAQAGIDAIADDIAFQ